MRLILVRPEPEAGQSAVRLARLGHEVVNAPLLVTEPVAQSRADGPARDDVAALVVTSPRSAGLIDDGTRAAYGHLPIFAVGDRTAAAMREAGFADVRSAAGDIVALGRLIAAAGLPAGARLLSLGGEERAGDLAALIAPAGLTVERRILYRMAQVGGLPPSLAAALRAPGPAAVLHYSSRSAETFVARVGEAGLAMEAARLDHLCLSPAVAAPLTRAGFGRLRIAATPDEAALFALIED